MTLPTIPNVNVYCACNWFRILPLQNTTVHSFGEGAVRVCHVFQFDFRKCVRHSKDKRNTSDHTFYVRGLSVVEAVIDDPTLMYMFRDALGNEFEG